MTPQRSKWRAAARVLTAVLTVSVPALALAFFASSALGVLSGPAATDGGFRVLDTTPPAAAVVKAPVDAPDDATEVQLTNWENTKKKISKFK